jgi:hypothetical protein
MTRDDSDGDSFSAATPYSHMTEFDGKGCRRKKSNQMSRDLFLTETYTHKDFFFEEETGRLIAR